MLCVWVCVRFCFFFVCAVLCFPTFAMFFFLVLFPCYFCFMLFTYHDIVRCFMFYGLA